MENSTQLGKESEPEWFAVQSDKTVLPYRSPAQKYRRDRSKRQLHSPMGSMDSYQVISLVLKSSNLPNTWQGTGCTVRRYWDRCVVCMCSDSGLKGELWGGGMSVLYFLLAVFWLALLALPGLQTRKHHTANIPDAKGNCSNSNPDSNLCVSQWQTTHRSVRIYISFNMVKHRTQQNS